MSSRCEPSRRLFLYERSHPDALPSPDGPLGRRRHEGRRRRRDKRHLPPVRHVDSQREQLGKK